MNFQTTFPELSEGQRAQLERLILEILDESENMFIFRQKLHELIGGSI